MAKKKKNKDKKKLDGAEEVNLAKDNKDGENLESDKDKYLTLTSTEKSHETPPIVTKNSAVNAKRKKKKSVKKTLKENPKIDESEACKSTKVDKEETNLALDDNQISSFQSIQIDLKLNFSEELDVNLNAKWPKPKQKVPDIFLHNSVDLSEHAHRLLAQHINFFHPHRGRYATKICCPSMGDYKALKKYFEKYELPYHTFGLASKSKMKVVIRGIEKVIDTNQLKNEIKDAGVPVVRVHQMKIDNVEKPKPLYLAVVPNDDKGRKLLRLKSVLGKDIKLEPAQLKAKQCYRCQMWGHSQRYCYGEPKCVKCAENHLTKQCERGRDDPLKCANCGKIGHVASWRKCPSCPNSDVFKLTLKRKLEKKDYTARPKHSLVTHKTCNTLYRNVKYEK